MRKMEVSFMKRLPTIVLRCAVFAAGAVMLGICFMAVFVAVTETEPASQYYYLSRVFLAGVFLVAPPFFAALFQAYKLLGNIDAGRAFSESSAKSLRIITRCAIAVFVVCLLGGLPFSYMFAQTEDAPGVVLMALAACGISFIVAVFASVLSRLSQDAIGLKAENDLTV
jgi:ABC-type spermidine/putrescine transport system permease subunit I